MRQEIGQQNGCRRRNFQTEPHFGTSGASDGVAGRKPFCWKKLARQLVGGSFELYLLLGILRSLSLRYLGEHILKTSEAVETTGVTIIRRGTQRQSFKAEMALELYPHLQEIFEFPGFKDKLTCEVSTSNEKHFPLVDFIDTPGLTDGHLEYAFDIDNVLLRLADHADMICIFLDPHKQAHCGRTMKVVRSFRWSLNTSLKCLDHFLFPRPWQR